MFKMWQKIKITGKQVKRIWRNLLEQGKNRTEKEVI